MVQKARVKQPEKARTAPAEKRLTERQERFVAEYLTCLNATEAYRRSGYKVKSEAVAATSAHNLLRIPKITAKIAIAIAQRSQRTQVTQDRVIQILLVEATRVGGDSQHAARVKAAQLLGRHLGMFGDENGVHFHQHLTPAQEQDRISQEQVLEALPLEMRIQLLETVKRLQHERDQAALAKRIAATSAVSGDVIEVVTETPLPPDQETVHV